VVGAYRRVRFRSGNRPSIETKMSAGRHLRRSVKNPKCAAAEQYSLIAQNLGAI
jgi:hypothetical protein